jgi:hypothetical protein
MNSVRIYRFAETPGLKGEQFVIAGSSRVSVASLGRIS